MSVDGDEQSDNGILLLRFDYAWKYFEFHAKQRTTMYNFFLVFSAIIIGSQLRLISEQGSGSAYYILFLSIVGALMTVAFICIDRRNEELVHCAEMVLKDLEENDIFENYSKKYTIRYRKILGCFREKDIEANLGILTEQNIQNRGRTDELPGRVNYRHSFWLPITQILILFTYLLISAAPFLIDNETSNSDPEQINSEIDKTTSGSN